MLEPEQLPKPSLLGVARYKDPHKLMDPISIMECQPKGLFHAAHV